MDRILELLGRLAELTADENAELAQLLAETIPTLSADEVASLDATILEAAAAIDDDAPTADQLASLDAAATGHEACSARAGEIATEEETRRQAAADARARLQPAAETSPDDLPADPPAEGEPAADPPAEGEPAGEPAGTGTPQAIAAAAPRISDIRARVPQNTQRPARTAEPRRPRMRVLSDSEGYRAGHVITDPEEAGKVFADQVAAALSVGDAKPGTRFKILRFEVDYPADHVLDAKADPAETTRRMDAVSGYEAVAKRVRESGKPLSALVASGGLCAPVEADYGLQVVSTADRPVKSSLDRFNARRGGIRFVAPPQLANLDDDAIGVTTATQDAGGATKPIKVITCPGVTEELVQAVSMRLRIGNFSRFSFPEQFAAWYDLGLSAHAREAEIQLLTGMDDLTLRITDGLNLGAARDILETCGRSAAQMRNRHRTAPDRIVEQWTAAWVRDMIAADLARQLPGDNAMAIAYAEIDRFFDARNIAVHWHLDERSGADQIYPAQGVPGGGSTPLLAWKGTVEHIQAFAGSYQFLDGGTLDLGVEIRDSTLNASNNVEAFYETFEGVAFRGVEARRIRQTVCATGASAATATVTCTTGGGS